MAIMDTGLHLQVLKHQLSCSVYSPEAHLRIHTCSTPGYLFSTLYREEAGMELYSATWIGQSNLVSMLWVERGSYNAHCNGLLLRMSSFTLTALGENEAPYGIYLQ